MTSVCRELGSQREMATFMDAVTARFAEIYERRGVEISAGELAERVPDAEAKAAPPWLATEAGAAASIR
jgi:hypothetical protein